MFLEKKLNFFLIFIAEAPLKGENFEDVMKDIESQIMPGTVHWNHPNFFAYFPSGNSYPSILGDLMSSAFGTIGFSWVGFLLTIFFLPFIIFILLTKEFPIFL